MLLQNSIVGLSDARLALPTELLCGVHRYGQFPSLRDAISSLPWIETFLKVFNKNVAPRVGGGEQLAREMIGRYYPNEHTQNK